MKKSALILLAFLLPNTVAWADQTTDYLAQAISTLQESNAMCGFGLSNDAILAASTQLGANPADPEFLAAIERQRTAFRANMAYLTDDLKQPMCEESRALLTQMGL
jgi:hypothetical protein